MPPTCVRGRWAPAGQEESLMTYAESSDATNCFGTIAAWRCILCQTYVMPHALQREPRYSPMAQRACYVNLGPPMNRISDKFQNQTGNRQGQGTFTRHHVPHAHLSVRLARLGQSQKPCKP
eukprot:scaffold5022_cov224-Pinguiococcus_pyrenoidosus.AAC.2